MCLVVESSATRPSLISASITRGACSGSAPSKCAAATASSMEIPSGERRSAVITRPRAWRSVPFQLCPRGRTSAGGKPAFAHAQSLRSGQPSHLGERCVHTSAPNSMIATFQRAQSTPFSGNQSTAAANSAREGALRRANSTPSRTRAKTRRIFVSRTGMRSWNWKEARALAV